MVLTFEGMLLSAVTGTNPPEFGGANYTVLEFAPTDAKVFSLRAVGHLDLSKYLRKDISWTLGVEPKASQGKTSFSVVKVSGGGKGS